MEYIWQVVSTASAVVGIVSASLMAALFAGKRDPREPPFAKASIPFIGHIIGISRKSFNYYTQLRYDPKQWSHSCPPSLDSNGS